MILHQEKSEKIIRCFYNVYNSLGYGFLEKVYENALFLELQKNGFRCARQCEVKVYYESVEVGLYFCDILVDDEIILEIKAGSGEIISAHIFQLQNYLRATTYELGFILHFGEKPTFRRKIFTNDYK